MTAISVRVAVTESTADVAALAELRFAWRAGEAGERGDLDSFAPAFGAWWRSHASSHVAWIAEDERRAVGMAWLAIVSRIPGPERFDRFSGIVQSVYVRPELRGGGCGTALLRAVVAYALEHRLGYLAVHPSERSYALYERAGFAQTRSVLELGLTESRTPCPPVAMII